MMRFAINWLAIVIAVLLAAMLLPGQIGYGGLSDVAIFAVILAVLDTAVAPILRLLTFPITMITFGLFSLVINTVMFWLATVLFQQVAVSNVVAAFVAALLVSVVNVVIGLL